MLKLVTYRTGWRLTSYCPKSSRKKQANGLTGMGGKKEKSTRVDSIRRARRNFFELACCNDWQYMVTVTVAGDDDSIVKSFLSFINDYQYNHSCKIKYLGVFERGEKNGRWHFHALMSGSSSFFGDWPLSYRRTPYKLKKYYISGRLGVISGWKRGFTTVIKLSDDSSKAVRYISKYINPEYRLGYHYYYRSRNLLTPDSKYIESQDFLNWLASCPEVYSYSNEYTTTYIGDGDVPFYYDVICKPNIYAPELKNYENRLTYNEFWYIIRPSDGIPDIFLKNEV